MKYFIVELITEYNKIIDYHICLFSEVYSEAEVF